MKPMEFKGLENLRNQLLENAFEKYPLARAIKDYKKEQGLEGQGSDCLDISLSIYRNPGLPESLESLLQALEEDPLSCLEDISYCRSNFESILKSKGYPPELSQGYAVLLTGILGDLSVVSRREIKRLKNREREGRKNIAKASRRLEETEDRYSVAVFKYTGKMLSHFMDLESFEEKAYQFSESLGIGKNIRKYVDSKKRLTKRRAELEVRSNELFETTKTLNMSVIPLLVAHIDTLKHIYHARKSEHSIVRMLKELEVYSCRLLYLASDSNKSKSRFSGALTRLSLEYESSTKKRELLEEAYKLQMGMTEIWSIYELGNIARTSIYLFIERYISGEMCPDLLMGFHNTLYTALGSDGIKDVESSYFHLLRHLFNDLDDFSRSISPNDREELINVMTDSGMSIKKLYENFESISAKHIEEKYHCELRDELSFSGL